MASVDRSDASSVRIVRNGDVECDEFVAISTFNANLEHRLAICRLYGVCRTSIVALDLLFSSNRDRNTLPLGFACVRSTSYHVAQTLEIRHA